MEKKKTGILLGSSRRAGADRRSLQKEGENESLDLIPQEPECYREVMKSRHETIEENRERKEVTKPNSTSGLQKNQPQRG